MDPTQYMFCASADSLSVARINVPRRISEINLFEIIRFIIWVGLWLSEGCPHSVVSASTSTSSFSRTTRTASNRDGRSNFRTHSDCAITVYEVGPSEFRTTWHCDLGGGTLVAQAPCDSLKTLNSSELFPSVISVDAGIW